MATPSSADTNVAASWWLDKELLIGIQTKNYAQRSGKECMENLPSETFSKDSQGQKKNGFLSDDEEVERRNDRNISNEDDIWSSSMEQIIDHTLSIPSQWDIQALSQTDFSSFQLLQELLEPTPFGPQGPQNIVEKVVITANEGTQNQSLIKSLVDVVDDNISKSRKNKRPEENQILGAGEVWPIHHQQNSKRQKAHSDSQELKEEIIFKQESNIDYVLDFCNQGSTNQAVTPNDSDSQRIINTVMPLRPEWQLTTLNDLASIKDAQDKANASTSVLHEHHCFHWNERFQELCDFKRQFGHCLVPHDFPPNPKLSQWVKRQRYQQKLKIAGCHSTLTTFREQLLDEVGFVWDSHKASWAERLEALKMFRSIHGHCNVPSKYDLDPSLGIWVKSQRRQCRLHNQRKKSTMTDERISALNQIGFNWNPRKL